MWECLCMLLRIYKKHDKAVNPVRKKNFIYCLSWCRGAQYQLKYMQHFGHTPLCPSSVKFEFKHVQKWSKFKSYDLF